MFSIYHFIWLAVCTVTGAVAILYLKRKKPPLLKVLSAACCLSVLSELTKTFSVLEMVPDSDGTTMHLYLEMQHLPLHLCSVQILFIFFVRFAGEGKAREALLAFMYPSCILGAFLAIMIPTIFTTSIDVTQAFTHPLAYQYFLYHTMLVVLGVYIAMSGEVDIRPGHCLSSLGIIGTAGFVSIYLNSIFAVPTYVNGELVSVDYSTNFFFTEITPIGIELVEKWHWFAYMGVIGTLTVVMIVIMYIPFIVKARRSERTEK